MCKLKVEVKEEEEAFALLVMRVRTLLNIDPMQRSQTMGNRYGMWRGTPI